MSAIASRARAAFATTFLLAGMASALADPIARTVFPAGTAICFGRHYDAAHLKRTPGQKTTDIVFGRARSLNHLGDSYYFASRDRGAEAGLASHAVELTCAERDGVLACRGECDSFPMTLKPLDARTLLLTMQAWGCDDGEDYGKDDRVFRLDRLPETFCAAAEQSLLPEDGNAEATFPELPRR